MNIKPGQKIIVVLVALAVTLYFFLPKSMTTSIFAPTSSTGVSDSSGRHMTGYVISIEGIDIAVEIADSEEEMMLGLGGRTGLAENSGMLFVFNNPTEAHMWMKDMLFPIDMIWIDETSRIVAIKENALPESFPEIFAPAVQALFVLELPAGFVQEHSIKIGDAVEF